MVMGTSPANSEIQKNIRDMIKDCPNSLNIKEDILVYGKGKEHDSHLHLVLKVLNDKGIILRSEKCFFGKPYVKWFGNIYSKDGMSPDPDKCKIIKQWPQPKCSAEVKSFLQTAQFNARFLAGKHGDISYPKLTKPLCDLTKKNVRFHWGQEQEEAFQQIKDRLCSDDILVPYDTSLETRLYVNSSPTGTQATVAQKHQINNEDVWFPVNNTSRAWTPAEAGYGQIERESNGILTGTHMNKIYTLGTQIEVVTDHAPLLPAYNPPNKPKQLRVDQHHTKLLPFQYNVVYEPGKMTPCDYGSRHPPPNTDFTEEERVDWAIEDETDIFVNWVIHDQLPQAISTEILKARMAIDPDLQLLKNDIITNKTCRNHLVSFQKIFHKLSYIEGIITRGSQAVISTSLQAEVIGLAHKGHMGADKTPKPAKTVLLVSRHGTISTRICQNMASM